MPSSQCPSKACPLARFDPQLSSTYKDTGTPFEIVYGIGNANGSYARDTVHVGGITVEDQQFGLAALTDNIVAPGRDLGIMAVMSPESVPDQDEIANGIFGLGYPQLTTGKQQQSYVPFIFNLAQQNLIAEPVFSVYMGSLYDQGWSGDLLLGGIDSSKYQGQIMYVHVAGSPKSGGRVYTYWMGHGQNIRLLQDGNDGEDAPVIDHAFTPTRGFIIDTGTTLTYMDQDIAKDIVTATVSKPEDVVLDNASWTYIVPCDVYKSPHRLEFALSNEQEPSADPLRVSVPMKDLVIPLDSDNVEEASRCMFGVAPWSSAGTEHLNSAGMVLVGDTVLRSTYLVFDMGQNRIGFAQAVGSDAKVTGGANFAGSSNNAADADGDGMRSSAAKFLSLASSPLVSFLTLPCSLPSLFTFTVIIFTLLRPLSF